METEELIYFDKSYHLFFFVFIVFCLVCLVWCYVDIFSSSQLLTPTKFPDSAGPARADQTFPFPTIRGKREGARSRTKNRGEGKIIAMTKMKSGMAAKFPKTSGKLNYFYSHTLFLEAAVSQQGDLLLRQQFGLSHNITKLRRNYPALIGLTRPLGPEQK